MIHAQQCILSVAMEIPIQMVISTFQNIFYRLWQVTVYIVISFGKMSFQLFSCFLCGTAGKFL